MAGELDDLRDKMISSLLQMVVILKHGVQQDILIDYAEKLEDEIEYFNVVMNKFSVAKSKLLTTSQSPHVTGE